MEPLSRDEWIEGFVTAWSALLDDEQEPDMTRSWAAELYESKGELDPEAAADEFFTELGEG